MRPESVFYLVQRVTGHLDRYRQAVEGRADRAGQVTVTGTGGICGRSNRPYCTVCIADQAYVVHESFAVYGDFRQGQVRKPMG